MLFSQLHGLYRFFEKCHVGHFMHRVSVKHALSNSAVIPYLYILAIGLGIVVISFYYGSLEILERGQLAYSDGV